MVSGGARRTPVPVVPHESLEKFLQSYVARAADPFNFGSYNYMVASLGANGGGLVAAAEFIHHVLAVAPECQIQTKALSKALVSLQRSNALARFPLGANVWQGIGSFSDKQVHHWADILSSRILVLLNHVRRVRYNETKRRQCLANLTQNEQDQLQAIFDMVPDAAAPPPPSSNAGSSTANFDDIPDLQDVTGTIDGTDTMVEPGSNVEPDTMVEPGSIVEPDTMVEPDPNVELEIEPKHPPQDTIHVQSNTSTGHGLKGLSDLHSTPFECINGSTFRAKHVEHPQHPRIKGCDTYFPTHKEAHQGCRPQNMTPPTKKQNKLNDVALFGKAAFDETIMTACTCTYIHTYIHTDRHAYINLYRNV